MTQTFPHRNFATDLRILQCNFEHNSRNKSWIMSVRAIWTVQWPISANFDRPAQLYNRTSRNVFCNIALKKIRENLFKQKVGMTLLFIILKYCVYTGIYIIEIEIYILCDLRCWAAEQCIRTLSFVPFWLIKLLSEVMLYYQNLILNIATLSR